MSDIVREQIFAVRATGRTNMLDVNMVQRIAFEAGYYDLVNYLEDHRAAYLRFILTGAAT